MAIQVADNFNYSGKKFFDGRTGYATLSAMKAVSEASVPDGILAYVDETDKYYKFLSSNETDPTTGKWREFQTGGGGTTVVPNPSGTATAELSKLQIESVIYSIVTKAVDDLTNYYTKTNTYTKTEVDTIASNIKNSRFEVVSSLPTTNIKTNVIYLVPKSTAQTNNVKDEYINLDGTTTGWELIGSTDIDLSGYVTTTALNTTLADYVTTTALNTALADYMTTSAFNTAIADYYTKTEVDAITGDLDNLTTTAKTDLVAAINEAASSGGGGSSIQADPMPTASSGNLGSIIEYIGEHGIYEDYVASTTNWDIAGNNYGGNYVLENGKITLITQTANSNCYVQCKQAMTNKGHLKITRTHSAGTGSVAYVGFQLGTTKGGNDLYQSPSWGNTPTIGEAVIDEVDLSQYNSSTIYLTFKITVENMNSVVYEITKAEFDVPDDYKNGMFYQCVYNGSAYEWVEKIVSAADPMPAEDMSEVVSPLPSAYARLPKYSTEEQVVGVWIDGKPLYQCTFTGTTNATAEADTVINTGIANGANARVVGGYMTTSANYNIDINSSMGTSAYIFTRPTSNAASIYVKATFTSRPFVVTIQYTKTTD